MKANKFTIIASGSILIGLFIILVFSFLLESQSPQFEKVIEIQGSQSEAEVVNQQIVIKTNRQVDLATLQQHIFVTPDANFSSAFFENTLVVTFNEPLESSTNYELRIDNQVKDIYGKSFEEFTYEFFTKDEQLGFLSEDEKTLYKVGVDLLEPQELFSSSEKITGYYSNGEEYVVITELIGRSTIHYKFNNETGSILTDKQINAVTSTVNLDNIYISAVNTKEFLSLYAPDGAHQLYELDKDSKELVEVDTFFDNTLLADIIYIQMLPDGSGIQVKGGESYFYLVDTKTFTETIELGKFLDIADFDNYKQEYLAVESPFGATVTDFPYLTIVDSDTQKNAVTAGDVYVIDPSFIEDSIILSRRYQEIEGIKGLFELVELDRETEEYTPILQLKDRSIELADVSPDERYVAFEVYTQEDMQDIENIRSLGFQSKPGKAEIMIYDLISEELIQNEIRGIDLKWL